MIPDGWHKSRVHDCEIYTEKGRIIKCMKDGKEVFPHRWDKKTKTYIRANGMSYCRFMNIVAKMI